VLRRPSSVLLLSLLLPGTTVAAPSSFDSEDETVIKGEVLKPEISVIITRENLNKAYELQLDEDFLQKIVDSVKAPPF
jgi:hypothetical protein